MESKRSELEKIVDESFKEEPVEERKGQLARNKKNSEIARAKIAAGDFVSGYLKYDEQCIYNFLDTIFKYVLDNEDVIYLEEYYSDPNTEKTIPWGSLKATYGRHSSCDEIREAIKKILEIRLVKSALHNKTNANFTRFILQNNYGWKEKTEQDITLSTKEVKFAFGNPELTQYTSTTTEDES